MPCDGRNGPLCTDGETEAVQGWREDAVQCSSGLQILTEVLSVKPTLRACLPSSPSDSEVRASLRMSARIPPNILLLLDNS